MKYSLFWVDAFTDRLFHGNPAAVVPVATWPEAARMQQIAFENGLAETAFFQRTGPDRFHLRWFTPELEMDLCGHATLASAFVIFTQLGQKGDRIVFDSRSGPLTVTRQGAHLELDFPARPAQAAACSDALVAALGARPDFVARARDTLCVFQSAEDVLALRPDFDAFAPLDTFALIASAPGRDSDFVSRFFCPKGGVPEDPVTGSAHCTLVPYWADRLGKTRLSARQVSARGGELTCELRGDRVGIAGTAVLYLRGEIEI